MPWVWASPCQLREVASASRRLCGLGAETKGEAWFCSPRSYDLCPHVTECNAKQLGK